MGVMALAIILAMAHDFLCALGGPIQLLAIQVPQLLILSVH